MKRNVCIVVAAATALAVSVGCDPGDEPAPEEIDEQFSSEYEEFRLTAIAGPFEHPWAVQPLGEDRWLVTERPGRLVLVEDGGDQIREIDGLPEVRADGQGGMLDVAVHPEFDEQPWVYLTYSKSEDGGETATALSRGRLEGDALEDVEELFVQNNSFSAGTHYGSRIAWNEDGQLLMSIGDRGDPLQAQQLDDHTGTILRLEADGSVPEDNPFVDDDEALDEIYAYGLRNVQGMVVDPDIGQIWVTDHGPRGGDEINLIEAGENYGWPLVTLGLDYGTEEMPDYAEGRRMEGVVEPVHEFLPTHAPSGLALVGGEQFGAWQGNLLAGGLRAQRIRRVVIDEYDGDYEVFHEEELLLQQIGRIRDVAEGPDGSLYVVNDAENGQLFRIGAP